MTTNTMVNSEMIKSGLHPRNKHRSRYDFEQLIQTNPALAQFVKLNAFQDASIDFSNPQAVKALNRALLKQFYDIAEWDIPAQYLCPPIPGRADYLHYVADLLAGNNDDVIPVGESVRVLDIGVGANAIYPLIGNHEYGWRFVGADIDAIALKNAQYVLDVNIGKSEVIELRQQASPTAIFKGVVKHDEIFDLTMCNPPFHASLEDAQAGSQRKWQGLGKNTSRNFEKKGTKSQSVALNFGGQGAELYCAGGEEAFVNRMVNESKQIANQCLWFTSLISKAASLPSVYRALKKVNALEVKTIEMAQGQKKSRLVAWTFLDANQRLAWRNSRW
ncbi:MAG: 23S rRNA (adenine(1618)-N(6))-methyltransferase RlmF [Methylotenera sp.]|uniref:23S rRNA (adenine(1618)-N(6))-methyltransferase RlmF n=1 Tax=Methylotenera sp. TaxID=2051956 RepID=UPI0027306313|nr:23S rRNA (adenine(1618)-N(6))-methyltransferase RlmF [Methylotenera sp.]MDP1522611.1 23S rRNA (adenine(1618)-N(6))-methyltransferase RlmF [Methylotenera sp.]